MVYTPRDTPMRYLKRVVVDYTHQPPDTKIGDDTIVVCSECKKPGLAIPYYEKTAILHMIWLILNEDGSIEIEDEAHISPSLSPKADSPTSP